MASQVAAEAAVELGNSCLIFSWNRESRLTVTILLGFVTAMIFLF